MSETSGIRQYRPQTALESYAGVAPRGFQRYLDLFLDDERESTIESTLGRIDDSTIDQIERNDSIPFVTEVVPSPVTGSSQFILQVDAGDDNGNRHIQRTYGIYDDHYVAVICYGGVDDSEFDVYKGSVNRISSNSFNVDLDIENHKRASVQQTIGNATHVGVASVFNPLVFERERAAIENLPEESPLWDILVGERSVAFDYDAAANSEALDEELYRNQKQATAIDDALQASDVFCVQGPPGTGKTRFIREVVRRLVAAGDRVLVTAETNTAVDNVLMGSGNSPDGDSLLAYSRGHGNSSDELTVARNNRFNSKRAYIRNKVDRHTNSANVVCSTNNSADRLVQREQEFDVLVTDEAGQARKSSTFIPLQLVNRAIFVGDHKQLPATRQSDRISEKDNRHRSVFEHLYGGLYPEGIGIQFDTQFRMVPELIEFSNQEFYDGSIHTGTTHDSVMSQPIGLIDLDVPSAEESVDTSQQNQLEATAVAAHVKMLLGKFEPDEIGVIAAYSAQETLVRKQLETIPTDGTERVQVATIDRFQGSEKEAIIVSFTRSNADGNVGFLSSDDGPNRLNVALTRARQYCALVGDWDTLRTGSALYDRLYKSIDDRFQTRDYTEEQLMNLSRKLS